MKRIAILLLLAGVLLTTGCSVDCFSNVIESRNAWLEATGGSYDGNVTPRR